MIEGKGKRRLSPTEQAYQKLLANREAQEQFARDEAERKRQEEMAENFRRLEVMSPSDDRKIAPLPEVSGLPFSQERRDSKQALADAQAEEKKCMKNCKRHRGYLFKKMQPMQQKKKCTQGNLQRVQEENIRAALRGQKQKGKNQAQVSAGILEMISNANAPATPNVAVETPVTNVATTDLAPMPAGVETTINRKDANERIRAMAGLPTESEAPTPQISPADNAASVASSGGVNSSPHGAKEDERDDAMATNSENMDFDNETGIEQPKVQSQQEEPMDFTQPPTGLTQDAPPGTVPPGRDALKRIKSIRWVIIMTNKEEFIKEMDMEMSRSPLNTSLLRY